MILALDNNWPAVVKNLSRARMVWRRMLRILSREGAAPWVFGLFLNAVVQAVLLFRSDTWVGGHPSHGQFPGGVSGQGVKKDERTAPAEDTEWEVEIQLGGDGTGGGGDLGGGGIHQASSEHVRTVHCYVITVRPV